MDTIFAVDPNLNFCILECLDHNVAAATTTAEEDSGQQEWHVCLLDLLEYLGKFLFSSKPLSS